MKVLLNGSMYSKKTAGVGIWIKEGFRKLVQLSSGRDNNVMYAYSSEGLTENGNVKAIKLPALLEAGLKKNTALHRIVWNMFFLPGLARKYDLVFSFSSHGSPFIKNQIITIHDLICMSFPDQHKTQYFYFKYLMPSIIKSCKKIVTVSEYTKGEVIRYYKVPPERIQVINSAANHIKKVASFDIPDKEKGIVERLKGKKFFLTVGASYKHKNIERLITAMKMLNNDDLLVIVGSGNAYYNSLKEKYADEQIQFLEYVSLPMLGYLYAHCIANVYVSLYEGMGLPPYEAAVYNTVTIASNTTALPEIYGDAVYYVNPLDTKEIANTLSLFSEFKIDKSIYQSRFPDLLKKYTWERTAASIHNLINEELSTQS
jgi:glycosyltransferase involved in cell wall biosynthesis